MDWLRDAFGVVARLRYPVSLPEDVAQALGVPISNFISFKKFSNQMKSPDLRPTRLTKFMSREAAEQAFGSALRREKFPRNTLCSYFFNNAWLEFSLHFDDQCRLRRLYVNHRDFPEQAGIEIPLNEAAQVLASSS